VRETWGLYDTEPKDGPEEASIFYRATDDGYHSLRYQKWRPSIHMPRWASRITLEITSVHVERLQDGGDREFWGEAKWAENPWVWVIEFKRIKDGS